jgi:hypothetical protein
MRVKRLLAALAALPLLAGAATAGHPARLNMDKWI